MTVPALTVRAMVAVWVRLPLVPFTVTLVVPVAAVELALRFRVLLEVVLEGLTSDAQYGNRVCEAVAGETLLQPQQIVRLLEGGVGRIGKGEISVDIKGVGGD
jgi:hypothetical protein